MNTHNAPATSKRFVVVTVSFLAAMAMVAPGRAAALSPITPDNAPSAIPGASNGLLPDSLLRWVSPRCALEWQAAPSMAAMLADAHGAGVALLPSQCYRDLAGQVAVRDYWCAQGHCEFAAVPGTSKHGWAKAADMGDGVSELTFSSPAYLWLKANGWRYGWNHPGWAEPDGSAPEPWHWEWVGDGGIKYPGLVYPTPMGAGIVIGGTPIGGFDALVVDGPGRVRAVGWAIDPDVEAAVTMHAYLDGRLAWATPAAVPRGDVAAAYPGYGLMQGFSIPLSAVTGTHTVCVYAINTGIGAINPLLGCRDITLTGEPVGNLDVATVQGGVNGATLQVQGWAIDPDTSASIAVHIYLDDVGVAVPTGAFRGDLAAAFPAFGGAHGFSWSAPLVHGRHTVCAFGISVGPGGHALLGCRTLHVDRNPIGSLDSIAGSLTPAGASVTVGGWALDPDTVAPIPVHVYVDGVGVAVTADRQRGDVGVAFPASGSSHGFVAQLDVSPGGHTICAYAINIGAGTINSLLGCGGLTVSHDPVGSFDAVAPAPGGVIVSGWAFDPDLVAAAQVHIYVDGSGQAVTADRLRPDVGEAFPGYGDAHGWSGFAQLPPGAHRACVYVIGMPTGTANVLLGCRSFTT